MWNNSKNSALLFIVVFGILLLHQVIPHTDHYIRFDHHHHQKEDVQRVPLENHAETYPSEYLVSSREEISNEDRSLQQEFQLYPSEHISNAQIKSLDVYPRLVLFKPISPGISLGAPRGPPQIV